MEVLNRLNDVVFPDVARAGGFGEDVRKFICFKTNGSKGTDQFCSAAVFGEVTLEKEACERFGQPVLVKTQSRAEFPPKAISDAMFYDEVLFYAKIMPLLRKYDKYDVLSSSFPEYVYGKATNGQNPEEDVLVLKDLRQRGFKPCVNSQYLDEEHIELALDRLGKYHALSFMCKTDDPDGFEEVTSQIKQFNHAGALSLFGGIISKKAFSECMFRGIEPLQKEPKYRDRLSNLSKNCQNAYDWFEKYASGTGSDNEQLRVIDHGDFHIGNMMFRYQADGKPIEVAFFDFAVIRYRSPAIDLSKVLLFSVPPCTVRNCWGHLLGVYYDALSCQMADHRGKPSLEAVELDLRMQGIYAYYLQAICTPWVISMNNGVTILPPPKLQGLDENQSQKTVETYIQNLRERGGTSATEILSDLVRLMIDMDFIFQQ